MRHLGRIHFWHAAEDHGPLHRHGRAHVYLEAEPGKRDRQINVEWRLLVPLGRSHGIGGRFTWGTPGSETTPDISINLSHLGDLWLGFSGLVPDRLLTRHKADGKMDYDTREFEIRIANDHFHWAFWAREHAWSSKDPWWMYHYTTWDRLILGKTSVKLETIDKGRCVVPLPEGSYPAEYEITRITHRYDRDWRLGRIRDALLGPKSFCRTQVEADTPPLVPGKGENSWDTGDDHIHSIDITSTSVPEVVGRFVETVLRQRKEYGGEHLSIPAEATEGR